MHTTIIHIVKGTPDLFQNILHRAVVAYYNRTSKIPLISPELISFKYIMVEVAARIILLDSDKLQHFFKQLNLHT